MEIVFQIRNAATAPVYSRTEIHKTSQPDSILSQSICKATAFARVFRYSNLNILQRTCWEKRQPLRFIAVTFRTYRQRDLTEETDYLCQLNYSIRSRPTLGQQTETRRTEQKHLKAGFARILSIIGGMPECTSRSGHFRMIPTPDG